MSHSPLPWRVTSEPHSVDYIDDAVGNEVAMVTGHVHDSEFIVTAVNAHAEMLAALKDARLALHEIAAGNSAWGRKTALKAEFQARAAIAKVEGATHVR